MNLKVGGETLSITLKTGILGQVSQISTQRIAPSLYIRTFLTIKASPGEYKPWLKIIFWHGYLGVEVVLHSNIYLLKKLILPREISKVRKLI